MPDANKALREEYEVTLIGFIQRVRQIIDKAKDDPLLRAQAIITIVGCVPIVSDFSTLKENLLAVDLQDRRTLIKECVLVLADLLSRKAYTKETVKIASAIEALMEIYIS